MITVFFIIAFVVLSFMFNKKVSESKQHLMTLSNYSNIDWISMDTNAKVQFLIIKNIVTGKSKIEKELKFIFLAAVFSFLIVFISMLLIFTVKA